jgi:hypothetical protein
MFVSSSIRKKNKETFDTFLENATNNIYSTLTQTEPHDTYIPSDTCDMFSHDYPCKDYDNAFGGKTKDWTYDYMACPFAGSKKKCSKVDPNLCDIGKSSSGNDPFIKVVWAQKENIDRQPPKIRCTYDMNNIDTLEQINAYMSKSASSDAYDQIMQKFCNGESESCPRGPNSDKNMEKCSRLKSTDDAGERCRGWLTKQDEKIKDNIIENYCLKHPNNEDCKCQNRANEETYREAKSGHEIPDGCWYIPCSTSAYLQDSLIEKGKEHCPQNMCKMIYDLKKNNDVVIRDNSNTINCNFQTFRDQEDQERWRKEEEERRRKEEEERRRREEEERRRKDEENERKRKEEEERRRREEEERRRRDEEEGRRRNDDRGLLIIGIAVCVVIIILLILYLKFRR